MHAIQDGITLIVVVLIQAKNVVHAMYVVGGNITNNNVVLQTMLIVRIVLHVQVTNTERTAMNKPLLVYVPNVTIAVQTANTNQLVD